MQSKICVLQVIPNLDVSGASQGCIDIANFLSQQNHESYILTYSGDKIFEVNDYKNKVINASVHSKNPIIIIFNILKIINLIKKLNINIVHARSRAPAWSSYLACKITGTKFITTFHGTYNYNNSLKKFYNSIMLRSDCTIAISRFIEDQIRSKYSIKPKNLQLIQRGIDVNYFNAQNIKHEKINELKKKYNFSEDTIKILLPGRLTKWKGQLILIKAIKEIIKKTKIKISVIFVGQDDNLDLKNKLIYQIKKLKINNTFHFAGVSNDMVSFYGLSDIVVSTSTDPEAFGRIAVEAQSMGKFVIASNHGGSTETIINEKTGYLYSPQDHIDLADKIIQSIKQKKYCSSSVSIAGINNVRKNYTVLEMCKKTLDVYKKIIL